MLFFIAYCLLSAILLAYLSTAETGSSLNEQPAKLRTQLKHGMYLLVVFVIAMGLVGFFTEWMLVRKILIRLAMPVGVCWIGLILVTYFLFLNGRRNSGFLCLGLTLVFSLAGNVVVSWLLASSLENPHRDFDYERTPEFDVVILLGGGTMTGYNVQPQLGPSGDRVMLALHMFVSGKAKKIVCTGSHISLLAPEGELSPGEQSQAILVRSGVPAGKIELVDGRNTYEEIANLADKFHGSDLKIGVISSAWHLPRVMRLANTHGLRAEPLPANFLTPLHPVSPFSLIPTSGNMRVNEMLLKEWLARLVGQ